MRNPMFQATGLGNQNNFAPQFNQNAFFQLKNAFNIIRYSNNPSLIVQQMLMQNPQFANAMSQAKQYINSYGGNAPQAIYDVSKQVGVDLGQLFN